MAGPDPHPTHQSYPSPHSMLGAWLDGHLHDVIVVRCVSPTPPRGRIRTPCGAHSKRRPLTEPGGTVGSGL